MEYEAEQYYPGFSRCIYLKGYRYNLHLRPRSVLLEVGAQTNTVEEVKNAMGPFRISCIRFCRAKVRHQADKFILLFEWNFVSYKIDRLREYEIWSNLVS